MRIFVAGATGVVGRQLVPMLVEAGHDVTGLTRSPAKTDLLTGMGATPVIGDSFDPGGLRDLVVAAQPEVVIHQLTDLPSAIDPRKAETQLAGNDRLRVEGTRNLVDAALAASARRIVAQSIAFIYAPGGSGLHVEDDPLALSAPGPWARTAKAVQSLEDSVTTTDGIEGIVLRYGFFYGAGSAYAADGYYAKEAKRRRIPLIGEADGVFSFVHVEDAAAAAVAAIDQGTPGTIYNVADDDPAPARDWIPAYAQALGAKPPRHVPRWLARLIAGPQAVGLMTEMRGASNRRAKAELGWQPRYASWRDGFRTALG